MSGVVVRWASVDDAPAMFDYIERNREFLAPFEPARGDDHFTLQSTATRLADEARLEFVAVDGDRIVGQVAISNVARAPVYLNCTLGYSVDEHVQGRGIATSMVRHAVHHAFAVERLHRVEAGTLVHNVASQRVLEKAGFTRIGISPRLVKIAGSWQDHVLFAITREDVD